jgi:hypothetical protein
MKKHIRVSRRKRKLNKILKRGVRKKRREEKEGDKRTDKDIRKR